MTDLIETFIRPLCRSGINYMVTGSVAAMVYGEPRLTNDIDVVLFMASGDIAEFVLLFPGADYYLPPEEIIESELVRVQRGHFNIIHQATMLKADVYLSGKDPLHRWALQNCRTISIDGMDVCFAPPEYVILRKLEFYKEGESEKHLRDIAAILEESSDLVNQEFIGNSARTMGLENLWLKIRPGS